MESKTFELVSGLRIHTLVNNNTQKPCLVFLHGYPSNCWLWRNILPGLADNFNIFAPDLPGHGKSDKPAHIDYDLDFFYDFLLKFFKSANIEKASIVAHDLGAMAAIALAVRSPELISRFVIMNTGPYREWPVLLKIFLFVLKQKMLTPLFLTPVAFKHLLKEGLFDKSLVTDEMMKIYRDSWIGSSEGKRAFSKTIDLPAQRLVESVEDIRRINLPTLVLWGKKDKFFPSAVAWQLHKDIPDSKLVLIPDAGHFLQEEKPKIIIQHLDTFLK